jgi:hypothetical protein
MNADRIEHRLPDILVDLAAPHVPDYVDDVLRRTASARQRAAWSYPQRWLPVRALGEPAGTVTSWRPIVALALLLLAVAVTVVVVGAQPRRTAPETQTTSSFRRPFDFEVDPASGMSLQTVLNAQRSWTMGYGGGTKNVTNQDQQWFGVDEEDDPRGVVVRLVTAVQHDPCHSPIQGGPVMTNPTPQAFVAYLQGVPGLVVSAPVPATVDGRPALAIDITQLPEQQRGVDCPDLFIWRDDDFPFTSWSMDDGWTKRMLVLDVDGDTVAVIAYARHDLATWLPTAQAFIDTIHFLPASATPSP